MSLLFPSQGGACKLEGGRVGHFVKGNCVPFEDEKQIVDAALEAEKRSVLAKLQGFFRIKTLAPNVCRVTMVAQGSLGGSFTKQAMAWGIKSTLGMMKTLQDKYMRNGAKVDAEMRAAFPAPPLRRSLTSEQVRRLAHFSSPPPHPLTLSPAPSSLGCAGRPLPFPGEGHRDIYKRFQKKLERDGGRQREVGGGPGEGREGELGGAEVHLAVRVDVDGVH